LSDIVDIEIKPWKKLTIHEVIKNTVDTMVKTQAMAIRASEQNAPLQWAGGILFRATAFPDIEETVKEMMQDRLHWMAVEFAPMKKYTPILKDKEINTEVPIVDVGYNKIFLKLAQKLLELAS
jgi:hypothetical protein